MVSRGSSISTVPAGTEEEEEEVVVVGLVTGVRSHLRAW
jgi:hypothetical protein